MKILTRRRWIGLGLICLSAAGAFYILGDLVVHGGDPVAFMPEDQIHEAENGSWIGYAAISVQINPFLYYSLLAAFFAGLGCFFWPARRPDPNQP